MTGASPWERTRRAVRANHHSSQPPTAADAIDVQRPSFLLSRPGALVITAVAATDLVYRLLLRDSVRRALGMQD
jgi:hypothetical protein